MSRRHISWCSSRCSPGWRSSPRSWRGWNVTWMSWPSTHVAGSRRRREGVEIALVPITTAGDRDRSKPFGEIGSRGVFVKEIEEALLDGRIDAAVHSAKDMTSSDTDGLAVGAYLEREDPRDALCGARELRPEMRVGTASVRRRAQLLALEGCGLDRLGLAGDIGRRFAPDEILPEAGQGALALQVRAGERGWSRLR